MQKKRYDAHEIRTKIRGTWSTTNHHDCFMMSKFARAPIPCRMHRTSRVEPTVQSSCKGISGFAVVPVGDNDKVKFESLAGRQGDVPFSRVRIPEDLLYTCTKSHKARQVKLHC